MFEIKKRDGLGRVGFLSIGDKTIETPMLLPVINPKKQTLSLDKISDIGYRAIITNSYLIYKNNELREKIQNGGIHSYLNYDGIIFTDSGSYQLMKYSKDITYDMISFQKSINSDVINIVDIPTLHSANYSKAQKDLNITLDRSKDARARVDNFILSLGLQGGYHKNLREHAAEKVSKIADIVAVGGIVPLMEQYKFSELIDILAWSSLSSNISKPKHAFGLGHPLLIPLAVSLGYDIFDSASYALFAREGRYLTSTKTLKLDKMYYLPCTCPICHKNSVDELNKDRTLLAQHNLYVLMNTIKKTKEAIFEDRLYELVQSIAAENPFFKNLINLRKFSSSLYKRGSLYKKSGLYFVNGISEFRPEIKLFLDRLNRRFKPKVDTRLVILGSLSKPYSMSGYDTIKNIFRENDSYAIFSPPFGIIPYELWDIYPVSHTMISDVDSNLFKFTLDNSKRFLKNFREYYNEVVVTNVSNSSDRKLADKLDLPILDNIKPDGNSIDIFDLEKFNSIFRYQFGFELEIDNLKIEK